MSRAKTVASPYSKLPESKWLDETKKLVGKHPLFSDVPGFLGHIDAAWSAVWQTNIGAARLSVPFKDIDPPATVVGPFFEKLLAHRLKSAGGWRGQETKDEKDVVCEFNSAFSFEVKTSGQKWGGIFGNRSFNQESKSSLHSREIHRVSGLDY